MATPRQYYDKAHARILTGADAAELFAASIDTTTPHPPHPHAHLSRDGFAHERVTQTYRDLREREGRLLARVNNRYRTVPPEMKKWKAELQKVKIALAQELAAAAVRPVEGRHLDPATRDEFPAENRLQDPATRYIDRAHHSQFEDSESAVMALVYALNSSAGETALYQISAGYVFSASYNRAVIHSITAARGLALHPTAPAGATSAHPSRNQPIRMLDRGQGGAGAAPRTTQTIARVTTVLDSVDNELVLVTHYPTSTALRPAGLPATFTAPPASTDYVQLRQRNGGGAGAWHELAAETPARMRWTPEESTAWYFLGWLSRG